jgi:hypothetical protein
VLIAVVAYLVMRIWTYLVYAETRLEISQQPLTADDVAWFEQTLATDFRIVLLVITFIGFLLATFVPASPAPPHREPAAGQWAVPRWVPQPR